MFPPHLTVNPFGPHSPAPKVDSQTDVPLAQFKAAQAVYATHLSADGQRVYCTRYGQVLMAKWDKWNGFGAWEPCDSIPSDAVVIE